MSGTKQSQSVDSKVLARIRARGRGWVFTPAEFAHLGTPTAVHLALMRNTRAGTIRRLARGIYDYPRNHAAIGVLSPAPEAVAKALQSKDASRLMATGAYTANLLGLSDQVPARVVFLTDGRARRVRIGKQEIVLQHRSTRTMATAGRPSGILIQALQFLGRAYVDEVVLARVRDRFDGKQLRAMVKDARFAPPWIAEILRSLAADTRG